MSNLALQSNSNGTQSFCKQASFGIYHYGGKYIACVIYIGLVIFVDNRLAEDKPFGKGTSQCYALFE